MSLENGNDVNNCEKTMPAGRVTIVGAGPGDEGLITLRGVEALRTADVVVYDYLVNTSLLRYCREDCETIYAGKKAAKHTFEQEDINELLVERARSGAHVVRLKGGDPFIFGRGGEEALYLAERGIAFSVVSGITAAVAAAAYAGIPLTHRKITSTVALITGHEDPTKSESAVDWEDIAKAAGTLVFYMGVKNLPNISRRLIELGRDPGEPVALVRWGTLERQQTLTATLATVAERAAGAGFRPPAVLVVGQVVQLRESLRWFDSRPLFARRIVVTRSSARSAGLILRLRELGAETVEFPTLSVAALDDFTALENAISHLGEYSCVAFTSVQSAEAFFERLFSLGRDARALASCRVAAFGSRTIEQLRAFGVVADMTPRRFDSPEWTRELAQTGGTLQGKRILIPGSRRERYSPAGELEALGARVERVPVYNTVCPEYPREEVEKLFEDPPDLFTFVSPAAVRNLVHIMESAGLARAVGTVKAAVIGPITREAAKASGMEVAVEAKDHTTSGLLDCLERYFNPEPAIDRHI